MDVKNQSFRFRGVMLVTAFVLGVSLFTGCFNFITSKPMEQPSEEQLVSQVEELACGESIEYLGNGKFSSLERDLEFAEQWTMTYSNNGLSGRVGTWVLDSKNVSLSGSVAESGNTNYLTAVTRYWNNDISNCMNEHDFDIAEIGEDEVRIYGECIRTVNINIPRNISESQKNEIDDFILQLRDICIMEAGFHTADFDFCFFIRVFFTEPEGNDLALAGEYYVTANSADDDILIDRNIDWDADFYQSLPTECEPGKILIAVNHIGI